MHIKCLVKSINAFISGVLLLNCHLSYSETGGLANVWSLMTDFIVKSLSAQKDKHICFLLLGQEARTKERSIDTVSFELNVTVLYLLF